jgi:hypothetical protein
MDIDDSDESQVDTCSGGIPGGIPKTTTTAPDADDHKKSLHSFPNHQQVTVRLIINRNMLPEGALTDDVLDIINTTHDLRRFPLSYHSIKRFFFNLDFVRTLRCNDSVGLLMKALAYLDHDTSNTVT